MNNPAAAASSIDEPINPNMVDGMQTLRTELDLARASQLTLLRLQLALHKSNRRAAMQALDDLLDLDAEMEGLAATLSAAPAHAAGDAVLTGFIEIQKAAIATEKHALAGGDMRDTKPVVAPAPVDEADDAELPAEPLVLEDEAESDDNAGGRAWIYVLAAVIVLVGVGLGLIATLWPELSVAGVSFRSFW